MHHVNPHRPDRLRVHFENGQQFLMPSDPYKRPNEEKTRLAGLILDVNGNTAAFLYNRKVYVMPYDVFSRFNGISTKIGDWIAFNFKEKNRLSTMFEVINPGNPPFPVSYTEENGMQVTITVIKRDKWAYPHKEVYVKMENGEYEKRVRYPNLIWSDAFDFIEDPNRLFTRKRGEKAMKVLSKLTFDWVAFKGNCNKLYSDVSHLLTVEPLEILGLADDLTAVLYSPWQIAAYRAYEKSHYGSRQPERLYLNKVQEKTRFSGIVISEEHDYVVVWGLRSGRLPLMNDYRTDESGNRYYKPNPPIGTFVSYSPARCKNSCKSFEAIEVEVTWEVYDVKIIIEDNKPTPLIALDIVLPINFIQGGSHTIYHPFIGPMKVFYYQLNKFLSAKNPTLTVMDLLGREIRLWAQPNGNTTEAEDPWKTEFWRYTKLDQNLFNEDVCRM